MKWYNFADKTPEPKTVFVYYNVDKRNFALCFMKPGKGVTYMFDECDIPCVNCTITSKNSYWAEVIPFDYLKKAQKLDLYGKGNSE